PAIVIWRASGSSVAVGSLDTRMNRAAIRSPGGRLLTSAIAFSLQLLRRPVHHLAGHVRVFDVAVSVGEAPALRLAGRVRALVRADVAHPLVAPGAMRAAGRRIRAP